MSDIVAVEKELTKLTKIKPDKYDDRQDYLAAMARALERVPAEDYDLLSDPAYNWHTAACKAIDEKDEIPNFDEVLVEEADAPSDETDTEEAEIAPSVEDDDPEDEDPEDEVDEAEEPAAEEASDEPVIPKHKGGRPKKYKGPVDADAPPILTRVIKQKKQIKKSKVPLKPNKNDYTKLTGEKDRYGVVAGTKTSQALEMYEKGVTAQQIDDAIGGRFFNILRKLEGEGHRVEKLEGGVWKLTHKDDLKKGKK